MKKQEKLENIFKYIFKETNELVTDYIDIEEILQMEGYDDLHEKLEEEGFFDVEIIYYARAMEYLQINDTSLSDSLTIAGEMGYRAEDLNSEILASLLASEKIQESFGSYYGEIEEILSNEE
ncbi:MAG: hypothetical protein Unbinned6004contig1002_29 [Prokaryotic dsDNA virus sp.]|nr:MAG: hypothetical protein Unbinned6004contig1002_29 [Prokaryotic dsDNA virus sp.]